MDWWCAWYANDCGVYKCSFARRPIALILLFGGEERQEVIIMDKTYEMDGACRNDDKDHMPVE